MLISLGNLDPGSGACAHLPSSRLGSGRSQLFGQPDAFLFLLPQAWCLLRSKPNQNTNKCPWKVTIPLSLVQLNCPPPLGSRGKVEEGERRSVPTADAVVPPASE